MTAGVPAEAGRAAPALRSAEVGPHREAMRARVAEIAGFDAGRVSVEATAAERLGFTGGIGRLATPILRDPGFPTGPQRFQ
ncbi:hypothetical protein DFR50_118104 [Roseiarcus fermentans]|uniref:2-C-methyl-D-erythritol 2,4-cyclodiphosphate synthase domain-containing protein n=1 Tax=Roseiarcus fermentans TaxID=1473586 RepID=A0A366F7M0_9HYPH|nr:hypothetical protein DFR50_118104 [Roseiarcus fermentans]